MGNWIATIEGIGPHHNGKDYDVEAVISNTVNELAKNHTIKYVSVVTGGKAEVKDNSEK